LNHQYLAYNDTLNRGKEEKTTCHPQSTKTGEKKRPEKEVQEGQKRKHKQKNLRINLEGGDRKKEENSPPSKEG